MHATTQQLLSLRDGEPLDATVSQHVANCERCDEALRQLQTVRSSLVQLGDLDTASEENWNQKWAQVKQQHRRLETLQTRKRWLSMASAAAVVTLAVSLVFLNRDYNSNGSNTLTNATNQTVGDVDKSEQALLQWNSQLEQALKTLPKPPAVVRGSTAFTIAQLEDQIALMDYELATADNTRSNTITLLQNRGDLLDSLYKVRYTQMVAASY